ncbi:ribonuclease III [Starmerella bacillaris]|uniref:Ribonuclease III n=1 Tax=Starmerella bacillaris TaxID=1247836 RepID=A0AAV5REM6_STABA|nr:ribonuclease III [Starmerella bacillaris]
MVSSVKRKQAASEPITGKQKHKKLHTSMNQENNEQSPTSDKTNNIGKGSTPSTKSITAHELESIEHTFGKFSFYLKELVNTFPALENVDLNRIVEDKDTDTVTRALAKKTKIQFASVLCKNYSAGKLPVFDDILYARQNDEIPVPTVSNNCLGMESIDYLQANLIKASEERIEQLTHKYHGDKMVFEQSNEEIKKLTRNAVVHDPKMQTKRSKEEWPPKLPEIKNPELLRQVFTHKSSVDTDAQQQKSSRLNSQNERLEFMGDAVIGYFISVFLYNCFPNSDEGFMSINKANLVCNSTLFDFAVAYRLHEKLKTSQDLHQAIYKDSKNGLPDMKTKNKAIADLFESYVGGLAMEQGLMVVQKWLLELFTPLLENIREKAPVNRAAKSELYSMVGSADQSIDYIALNNNGPPYTVKCCIDGETLGIGEGPNIKEAGLEAATKAMANTELIEKFARRRRVAPRSVPNTSSKYDSK